MNIAYKPLADFPGWGRTLSFAQILILQYGLKDVLEIGAGANPVISPARAKELGISYTISDVEPTELDKADAAYQRRLLDLSAGPIEEKEQFDFIFSRMVLEHVPNGKVFHSNVFKLLKPGGIAFHCFSTLYALPFFINKLIPESVSNAFLFAFAARDKEKHGKFKAHYSWSRGPSKSMIRNLQNVGFDIIEYEGYFGHYYFRDRIPLLDKFEQRKAKFLLKHANPHLTSYATMLLRKPDHSPNA